MEERGKERREGGRKRKRRRKSRWILVLTMLVIVGAEMARERGRRGGIKTKPLFHT